VELTLVAGGLALQIVGAVLSFLGIHRTWRSVAEEGETFRHFILTQVQAALRAITESGRRLLGIPPRGQTITPDSIPSQATVGTPHMYVDLPAPPPEATTDAKIELLHRHINSLHADINRLRADLAEEGTAWEASIGGLGRELRSDMDRRASRDRFLQVDSLRMEIVGFWFLTLGMLIGGAGSFLGAMS
jgi:hypothetical protein